MRPNLCYSSNERKQITLKEVKMNYIKQSVAFFELQLIKQLSANAQAVYHILFNINNKCVWEKNLLLQTQ